MEDYQKVLLYLYPRLKRMAKNVGQIVEARAVSSVFDRGCAERSVEKLLGYISLKQNLLFLNEKMDELLETLSAEEKFLLEYKYFRRKRVLDKAVSEISFSFSERTYFRRQARLAEKMGRLMARSGLDKDWFWSAFENVPYMACILERISEGCEQQFSDKRIHATPHYRKSAQKVGENCIRGKII